MDVSIDEALVQDVLNIIYGLVRDAAPIHRANLRRVSRSLHAADAKFIVPAWVRTHHARLEEEARETPALRYFNLFVDDVCQYERWEDNPKPLEIRWDTSLNAENKPGNELRFFYRCKITRVKFSVNHPSETKLCPLIMQ
jgi:CRISPR/Cas system-associated endonuclease Cas3-HD